MNGKLPDMKLAFTILVTFIVGCGWSQTDLKQLTPDSSNYENIYAHKISSDSLSTSFAIWIKLKVKLHKHVEHTEHLYVLGGKGNFTIGNQVKQIKKGDLITIPKNTWHGVEVTSKKPMKVISVQSPEFKGIDRIFK